MKSILFYMGISALVLAGGCSSPEVNSGSYQERDVTSNEATSRSDFQASGWLSKTLPEIVLALEEGEISSQSLIENYLTRIAAIDKDGPRLQAILMLNPEARSEAKRLDELRQSGTILGPLHGVPIVLKDNIESQDPMPTTAGAFALKDNITGRDSPLVAGLRGAGAIILGKTNLSQWANFRSNQSMSGWSALGGQTRNPHILDRNPCGSSSGSGAAIAASLAAGAVGTETNGSIICPSNVNGIVGFKPTVGLVSQDFIIPISSTQDTAGPMTKSVMGAAMMLSAMATHKDRQDYRLALDAQSLSGARIGVLRFAEGYNPDIIEKFNIAIDEIKDLGAVMVEIETEPERPDIFWDASYDVLLYEFKATLNEYLDTLPSQIKTRTLEGLIEFNKRHADEELVLFGQDILDASAQKSSLSDPDYQQALQTVLKATREEGIDKIMREHNVDVLIAPSGPLSPVIDAVNGDVWPDWVGAGSYAAIAGYPHLTVPMGDVDGVPIGLSFIGQKNQDAAILSYGYAYEQATQKRVAPQYYKTAGARPELAKAMRHKGQ